jgi:transposase-like protein
MSKRSKKAPVVEGLIKERRPNGRNIYDGAARRELVRLCSEPGVSISMTALLNGLNANVLRRWIEENKRDPGWFNRCKSNDRASVTNKEISRAAPANVVTNAAKPMPALMLPIKLAKTSVAPALPSINPSMIEVELTHGRVRLHGVDAAMLATVFNLLSVA